VTAIVIPGAESVQSEGPT